MSSQRPTVVAADESGPAANAAWHWINDTRALAEFSARVQETGSFAIDTEFVRRRTYHAELGLVQLASGDRVYLLDPLDFDAAEAIGRMLADPAVRKLIHAGGEDIEVLQRWSGATPANLIDTQIASQLSGVPGQIGYQRLVAERLDIQLSKGEQQSDWMRRPLSEKQCRYAADDVRHLHALADQLLGEIERLGRNAWLDEDCQRQIDRVLSGPSEYPHLNERNAGSYAAAVQWRLCLLLRWREAEAQRRDKPRNWLLDGGLAVGIAHCDPNDQQAIAERLREAGRRDPERAAAQFAALINAEPEAPADFPLAPPPIDGEQKKSVKALRAALIELAEPLGLPPEFIATRAVLEDAVRNGRWPDSVGQWRGEVLQGLDPGGF